MKKYFDLANDFFKGMSNLIMVVLTFAVLTEVLFGQSVMGMDVIGNITHIVDGLGNNGVVGLIVVVLLMNLFNRDCCKS
tara:strand:+ start:51 stop:287 length:237 start_codon:yes stop_codon:yes gene_type:complete